VGALAAVRREHRQETYLIDVLRQAGERAGHWSTEDRRHVAAAAQALVAFQRGHHTLENAELFPLVEKHLNEQQCQELQAALELFDQRHEPRRSAALERMQALIERYVAPRHSGVQSLLPGSGEPSLPDTAVGDDTEPNESRLGVDL
jgi:hemerythrin-like domain-containing protein